MGDVGWEEYTLIEYTDKVRKIEHADFPLFYYIGALGKFDLGFQEFVGCFKYFKLMPSYHISCRSYRVYFLYWIL